MADLRAAHKDFIELEKVSNATIETKRPDGESIQSISTVNRVWGGDKRLSLYGYTLETINLLILPMLETK